MALKNPTCVRQTDGPAVVWVRNDTGADLTVPRPVVGLAGVTTSPSTDEDKALGMPVFSGVTPDGSHANKFAVLQGPVDVGEQCLAVISGGTWCKLFVEDENDDYRFADVDPGEFKTLLAAASGSGFVLWREGGQGEQWAFVRLSNPGGVEEGSGSSGGSGSGSSGSGSSSSSGGSSSSSEPDSSSNSGENSSSGGCDGFVCSVQCGTNAAGDAQIEGTKFSFGEAAGIIVGQAESDAQLAQRLADALRNYL